MKRELSRLGRVAALAIALSSANIAPADAAAINLTTPGNEYDSSQYTLGFEFAVNDPMLVGSLGVYDSNQDGIANRAMVAIWLDTGGAPLVSAIVPAGTAGELDGFFRYVNIAPLQLNPGTTYVIGAFLNGDLGSSLNTGQGGTGSIDPNVNVIRDRYSDFDSAFSFPTETDNQQGAWLGANFRGTTAVPEPATMALFAMGLAGLGLRRRR